MRLSELMQRHVHGPDGTDHGVVVDARLVQDGPPDELGRLGWRVDGLVVGRRATVARLGLLRPGVRGPAILVWPARWLGGHRDFVPWSSVQAIHEQHLDVDHAPIDLPEA